MGAQWDETTHESDEEDHSNGENFASEFVHLNPEACCQIPIHCINSIVTDAIARTACYELEYLMGQKCQQFFLSTKETFASLATCGADISY